MSRCRRCASSATTTSALMVTAVVMRTSREAEEIEPDPSRVVKEVANSCRATSDRRGRERDHPH